MQGIRSGVSPAGIALLCDVGASDVLVSCCRTYELDILQHHSKRSQDIRSWVLSVNEHVQVLRTQRYTALAATFLECYASSGFRLCVIRLLGYQLVSISRFEADALRV